MDGDGIFLRVRIRNIIKRYCPNRNLGNEDQEKKEIDSRAKLPSTFEHRNVETQQRLMALAKRLQIGFGRACS